ncbi:MAG: conserved rane protein of unknown function [Frankiales bacterium]|nr:conserved rane protein of unknown function [Frankiales bacterium]
MSNFLSVSPVTRSFDWTFRSRATGRITIAQAPNVSLVLFLVLRFAQALAAPSSTVHDVLHWAGDAALAWWALHEVLVGVNPFRRLLGGAVLAYLLVG